MYSPLEPRVLLVQLDRAQTNCCQYFRNTTVGGSITGEGLDLGVIDDPIKGRKEANSLTVRAGFIVTGIGLQMIFLRGLAKMQGYCAY